MKFAIGDEINFTGIPGVRILAWIDNWSPIGFVTLGKTRYWTVETLGM